VELAHVASSGELWRKLDTFHETVCPSLEVQTVVVGSVGTVASGFTVGYVLWALRSGLVLSSLFASMPAWTLLDPLAGVTIAEGMRKDEDEESLEQIAEKQSKRLSETHGKGAEMHN
jgi:hypothetical protein